MLLEQDGERVAFFAAAAAGGRGGQQRCALGAWCACEGVGQSKRRRCETEDSLNTVPVGWLLGSVGVF
jgi:hypothetical protein